MTWRTRLKLLLGALVVVTAVAALTLIYAHRQSEISSRSAAIVAEDYPVGTDYPGTVVEQFVTQGDEVAAGDPIARIQSTALVEALREGSAVASNAVFDVHPDGTLVIKSSVTGVVRTLDVKQGGYASAGATIAMVAATGSLVVEADLDLEPVDYARVEPGAPVALELPDGTDLEGEVSAIRVETVDGVARTTVAVASDALVYDGAVIAPGTPLTARVSLRTDDALSRAIEGTVGFVSGSASAVFAWLP